MIRKFELFCKLNRINISEILLLEKSLHSFQPENAQCPHCSAKGSLESHASYERYLICRVDDRSVVTTLTIPRFVCTCGHTHAILPAHLIPYGSYSLFFILTVLRAYFLRLKTVAVLCEAFGIAVSTLYAWIHLYKSHKSLWLGVLINLETSPLGFLDSLFEENDFLKLFFHLAAFSFLQGMSLTTSSGRSVNFDDP